MTTMFRKILIPLDGSALAEQALDPALRLAQWAAGEVILIRVPMYTSSYTQVSPAHEHTWSQESLAPIKGESAEYLRDLRQVKAYQNVSIRTMVVNGDRAGAIVDTAKAENVDLIAMSTHGRTGLSRWVFGSVTSRVLSHAPCPVLVIHKASPLAHILITLDGSLLAEQALEAGLSLAKAYASKTTLLRVIPDADHSPDQHALPENIALGNDQTQNEPNARQTEGYLQDLIAIHDTRGLEVNIAVISGPVASKILDYAAEMQVDLIAMTTHGRSGLRRWIYGSVTEKVLYGTSSAMLIIRPPEF